MTLLRRISTALSLTACVSLVGLGASSLSGCSGESPEPTKVEGKARSKRAKKKLAKGSKALPKGAPRQAGRRKMQKRQRSSPRTSNI